MGRDYTLLQDILHPSFVAFRSSCEIAGEEVKHQKSFCNERQSFIEKNCIVLTYP